MCHPALHMSPRSILCWSNGLCDRDILGSEQHMSHPVEESRWAGQ